MAIRIHFVISLFIMLFCRGQSTESLEAGYDKYYSTSLLTSSPSGEYIVLNHLNSFGKNEDELFNTENRRSVNLGKYLKYKFLGNAHLLMRKDGTTRFQNLQTNDYLDIPGNYSFTIIQKYNTAVLYDRQAKDLLYCSEKGLKKWVASNVTVYDIDSTMNRLVYFNGKTVNIRSLNSDLNKSFNVDTDIKWLKIYNGKIYFASIDPSEIRIYTMDLKSNKITDQMIYPDPDFVFADSMISYFEIRENEHFIFPLFLKSKKEYKEDPELKITYTNVSSKDNVLNEHLGIYNLKEKLYEYHPEKENRLPLYRFLNDKGDFVVFDDGLDKPENEDNVMRDFKLVLNYGKERFSIDQITSNGGNYLWDYNTRKFIYFKDKRWRCRQIDSGEDRELLPPDSEGWNSTFRRGISKNPEAAPVKVANSSSVLLSDQYDYFLLNLETDELEKITKGQEKMIKYNLQLSKDNFPVSLWNVKLAQIDLRKDLFFKLENKKFFKFGFAKYTRRNKNTSIYVQGHYTEVIPYKNGMLFLSEFALEPLAVTKVEKNKKEVVYEASGEERKVLQTMQYRIFQYTTSYGTSNAALLYPVNYDKRKKYPLIANIYENQTNQVLYFDIPNLRARDGFNYMHYLLNGYFVLLTDFQYDLINVKLGMIESLEKSIDTALLNASVDPENVAVLGLSQGGYETGLALGNSNYFKTGVAGVMISDLVSFALSNTGIRKEPNYLRVENQQGRMRSSLFDDWNNYLENSPIYHLKNVNAPVLIWTGSKDSNVPPTQSKMFFLGMKRLQKSAVLLEYTNETHTIGSRKNQLDLNRKIFDWFEYYLKNKQPAKWMLPLIK